MAADTKVVHGETSYTTNKIRRVSRAIVGAAGCNADIELWMDWFEKWSRRAKRKPTKPTFSDDPEVEVLILTPQGLFISDEGCGFDEIKEAYYAIGTGRAQALVAMDLGCDPPAAVEAAIKRDNNSGGSVQVISLNDNGSAKVK